MEFKSTEEARKWLAGKRWVNDEYDKLNRKLVELRISTGERSKSIDFPFAYLDPNGDLTHIFYVNINEWRSLSKYEIITSQDILSITIKDESRFKDGDILYAESNTPGTGWTIIFNPITIDEDCYKKGQLSYYAMLGAAGEILFDFHCDPAGFQLATEAQKERLFSALCKQNKMWDPIEKKITRRLHHKGRNKHHWEYWVDWDSSTGEYILTEIPLKYIKEICADMVGASKAYNKGLFDKKEPLKYFNDKCRGWHIKEDDRHTIEFLLNEFANK